MTIRIVTTIQHHVILSTIPHVKSPCQKVLIKYHAKMQCHNRMRGRDQKCGLRSHPASASGKGARNAPFNNARSGSRKRLQNALCGKMPHFSNLRMSGNFLTFVSHPLRPRRLMSGNFSLVFNGLQRTACPCLVFVLSCNCRFWVTR